jgi:hypothetical protein
MEEGQVKRQCQKSQLTGLSCDYVFTICSFKRLDPRKYINSYYTLELFINTWSDVFNSHEDP